MDITQVFKPVILGFDSLPPLLPIFVSGRHSASVCRARHSGDGCSNSAQVLDDGRKELLAGTLVQVEADLIGHQQVVLLHKLLQDVTHSLWVIEKYEALEMENKTQINEPIVLR